MADSQPQQQTAAGPGHVDAHIPELPVPAWDKGLMELVQPRQQGTERRRPRRAAAWRMSASERPQQQSGQDKVGGHMRRFAQEEGEHLHDGQTLALRQAEKGGPDPRQQPGGQTVRQRAGTLPCLGGEAEDKNLYS